MDYYRGTLAFRRTIDYLYRIKELHFWRRPARHNHLHKDQRTSTNLDGFEYHPPIPRTSMVVVRNRVPGGLYPIGRKVSSQNSRKKTGEFG